MDIDNRRKDILIIRLLRTPTTIKVIMLPVIISGIVFLYQFYLVGILLYVFIIMLLFMILENAVILQTVRLSNLLLKQIILFLVFIVLFGSGIFYLYQLQSRNDVYWNPIYYEYDEFNSKKYPSNGWFSGKREGGLPLKRTTGALGFGFSEHDANDPVYVGIDVNTSFDIEYMLEKTLLSGAIFEGKDDIDLTGIKIFFLKPAIPGSDSGCHHPAFPCAEALPCAG